jgi:GNAT superfamily N-acetyltransferase
LSARFGAVEPLGTHHRVDRFTCGREQLDRWLRAYAGQGQRRDTARTFVVCRESKVDVVGFYTLVASQVEQSEATGEVRRGASKHFPIPVCLIARLAVDRSEQGAGLGRSLLLDALRRSERASRSVAMRAVLVHALDEEAPPSTNASGSGQPAQPPDADGPAGGSSPDATLIGGQLM